MNGVNDMKIMPDDSLFRLFSQENTTSRTGPT
jgi:hypothetical protein